MRLKRVSGLAWQVVGPLMVVIDLGRGRSLGLNETAGLVWILVDEQDEAGIAAELERRYVIEPERARRDVQSILGALRERGFVEEA